MPIIKRESIEELRSKINIYDVVAPYVQLRRLGANWRGLSPFNEEKTPSFYVLPQKNIFKCFSSGHAGDVFKFVQLKEHLSFNEAVDWLARRFHLSVQYENTGLAGGEQASLRKELFLIHELAQSYYQEAFRAKNEAGAAIRSYFFDTRGFTPSTAEAFAIGYAPVGDRGLLTKLLSHSLSFNALKQSGLFYCREGDTHPSTLKPRFSGRLMIPIRDVQGRTIAFTARQTSLTPSSDATYAAKYINSPETPLFSKSYVLFGLDIARQHIKEHEPFVLVEGQLDVLRCCEKGLFTAVAPQGTAITEHQLNLIRRYTQSLDCFLDGDKAGQKAALRLLPLALQAGLDLHLLVLPPGEDPDSLLSKEGLAAYKSCQAAMVGPMAFAYSMFLSKASPSPQEKSAALEQIYSILQSCDSRVARQAYLADLARLASMDVYTLELDFAEYIKKQKVQNKLASSPVDVRNSKKILSEKLTTAEYELLLLLLHHEDLVLPVAKALDPEYIQLYSLHGRLLSRFINEIREGIRERLSPLEELLETEEEYNLTYTLLAQEPPFANPHQSANACIKNIFSNYIQTRKKNLELSISSLPCNDPKLRPLLEERLILRKMQNEAPKIESQF